MLKPVIVMMFILAAGKIFNSDFGLFYRTTRNSSSLTSVYMTLDVYVYNSIFNNSRPVFGYISAAGALQSVLGLVMMLLANGIVRKMDRDNALF
jgi:putative aldouronate transport system permease protein